MPSLVATRGPRRPLALRRAFAIGLAALLAGCVAERPPLVQLSTPSGPLAGILTRSGRAFFGVPYAAAPLGALRWREPEPAPPWSELRSAQRWPAGIDREDCLRFDLWLPPDRFGPDRPILVWVVEATDDGAASAAFDGSRMADVGIVVVAVHSRRRLLGVFAHPALERQRPGGPANFALLDLIAALQWVRENAALLGGDRDRVTLGGNGPAAVPVLMLLCTDRARGLFQRAILHDPDPFVHPAPLAQARDEGQRLLALGGLLPATTAADLRALPGDQLLRVDPGGGPLALPVLDGVTVTAAPYLHLTRGIDTPVPLLVGSSDRADADALRHAAGVRGIAATHGQHAPTFVFRFRFAPARPPAGASDKADVAAPRGPQEPADYLFASSPWSGPADVAAAQRWMTQLVTEYWSSFVIDGKPRCRVGPAWQPFSRSNDVTMVFDDVVAPAPELQREQLDRLLAEFLATADQR